MSKVIQTTDQDFESTVVKCELPVLVDFWAPWCGPCKAIGPMLEEIADEYDGKARIVKINVDEQRAVAGSMGVRSIPTLALFIAGEVKDVFVGARPKDDITSLLDKALTNE